ncbi:MAG: hypothetical protein EXR21_09965 [Flavobacteriaceae bacterium]|nr:hypothetical protein [Flavobacteriaceae bacterium]
MQKGKAESNYEVGVTKYEVNQQETMKTDKHATAIGKFYRVADAYTEKFKIGGKQKLQKIIGEALIYKVKDGRWFWGNQIISKMSILQLEKLTKKIEKS